MTGLWSSDWATGDIVTAAEFRKSLGCVADSTLGVSAASFDFTGLPTTYAALMVIFQGRSDTAALNTQVDMRFNNDSAAANYAWNENRLDGVTVAAADDVPGTAGFVRVGKITGATATANYFGTSTIWIPNYATGSAAFREFSAKSSGRSSNAANAGWLYEYGGMWLATTAISRLTLLPEAGNWITGSRCSIYVMGS